MCGHTECRREKKKEKAMNSTMEMTETMKKDNQFFGDFCKKKNLKIVQLCHKLKTG